MNRKDEKFPDHEQHKSARDVALYFRKNPTIGRTYNTHGDVWNLGNEIIQTGLLHLILDELESQRKNTEGNMHNHAEWLEHWQQVLLELLADFEKQQSRLQKMFKTKNLGNDASTWLNISKFSHLFRTNQNRHYRAYKLLVEKVDRMKSVHKPEDITNLKGIGKKTAAKILDAMKDKE